MKVKKRNRFYAIGGGILLVLLLLPAFLNDFNLSPANLDNNNFGAGLQENTDFIQKDQVKSAEDYDNFAHLNEWLNDSMVDEYFQNSPGDGSAQNPYVVEDLFINASGLSEYTYLWYIENTSRHIVFRNCTFLSFLGDYNSRGICIRNSSNVAIINCVFDKGFFGVFVDFSSNITVQDSTFRYVKNKFYGNINLNVTNLVLQNNSFFHSWLKFVNVINCSITSNHFFGISGFDTMNAYFFNISYNEFFYYYSTEIPPWLYAQIVFGLFNSTFENNIFSNLTKWERDPSYYIKIPCENTVFKNNFFNFTTNLLMEMYWCVNVSFDGNYFCIPQSDLNINPDCLDEITFTNNIWNFKPATAPLWQSEPAVVFDPDLDLSWFASPMTDKYFLWLNDSQILDTTLTGAHLRLNESGTYVFRLKALNYTGISQFSEPLEITYYVQDPTVPQISGFPDQLFLRIYEQPQEISWQITDDYVNNPNLVLFNSTDVIFSSSWYSGQQFSYTFENFPLGTHYLHLNVSDGYGNNLTRTLELVITEDDTGPQIFDVPETLSISEDQQPYSLDWHVSDIFSGQTHYNITQGGTVLDEGTWISDQNLSFSIIGFRYGNYELDFAVSDGRGNSAGKNLHLTILPPSNNIAPVISIPSEFVTVYDSQMPYELNFTIVDEQAIYPVFTVKVEGITKLSGDWNSSEPVVFDVYDLAPGVYQITITAEDGYGLSAEKTLVLTVVSNPAPSLSGAGLTDSSGDYLYFTDLQLYNQAEVSISSGNFPYTIFWQIEDDTYDSSANYSIWIDGELVVSDQPWSNNAMLTYQIENLTLGEHNVEAQFSDGYGQTLNLLITLTVVEGNASFGDLNGIPGFPAVSTSLFGLLGLIMIAAKEKRRRE